MGGWIGGGTCVGAGAGGGEEVKGDLEAAMATCCDGAGPEIYGEHHTILVAAKLQTNLDDCQLVVVI